MNIADVRAEDIVRRYRGKEREFVYLVDKVLRLSLEAADVSTGAFIGNDNIDAKDGGVDLEVQERATTPEGFLDCPTVWQVKSGSSNINAQDEIYGKGRDTPREDRYVVKRIAAQCGYRLCVAKSMTPEAVSNLEEQLAECVRSINPDAPVPRVLTAERLAAWVSRFFGIAADILDIGKEFLPFRSWAAHESRITPAFVGVGPWNAVRDAVHSHLGASTALLVIAGASGIGKTRMVLEAMKSSPGRGAEALYTSDAAAARLFLHRQLGTDRSGVLVVDELPRSELRDLSDLAQSLKDSIAVVAITNDPEIIEGAEAGVVCIEKPTEQDVVQVLAANFGSKSTAEIYQVAFTSGGYVRLAADMCQHGTAGASVSEYVQTRLDLDSQRALYCVSLVHELGWRGKDEGQLRALCALIELDFRTAQTSIERLNQTSGFIAVAGTRCYTTPPPITDFAFKEAWRRWGANSEVFLRDFPSELKPSFLERVRVSAGKEVADSIGQYFRPWAKELEPPLLELPENAAQLAALAEFEPEFYLPILAGLLEAHPNATAIGANAHWQHNPRRFLLRTLEDLAAFDQHWHSTERCLRQLAIHENDFGIVNNAVGTWTKQFLVANSGSSLPFAARFDRLHEVLPEVARTKPDLAEQVLHRIVNQHGSRTLRRNVVAGRTKPSEWEAADREQYFACFKLLVSGLRELAELNADLGRMIAAIAARTTRRLVQKGAASELLDLVKSSTLSHEDRSAMVREVSALRDYDGARLEGVYGSEYLSVLEALEGAAVPDDIGGKLLALLSRGSFFDDDHAGERDDYTRKLRGLARELATPSALTAQLPLLLSNEVFGAYDFGRVLGEEDAEGALLDLVLEAHSQTSSPLFARGYCAAVAKVSPTKVNDALDRLQSVLPALAFDFSIACQSKPIERAIELFEKGSLSVWHLSNLVGPAAWGWVSSEQLSRLVELAPHATGFSERATSVLEIIGSWMSRKEQTEPLPLQAKTFLRSLPAQTGSETWHWKDCLTRLAEFEPGFVIDAAADALVSAYFDYGEDGEEILISLASKYPSEVVAALSRVTQGADAERFTLSKRGQLLESLPTEQAIAWLMDAGEQVAAYVAGYLPAPYVTADGPVLPELTAAVLSTYDASEEVFQNFCHMHNGQIYSGTSSFEHEAATAQHFVAHKLRRVREWAQYEIARTEREITGWKEREILWGNR